MRTPEEWNAFTDCDSDHLWLIEEIQKEAYNQAIDDVIENMRIVPPSIKNNIFIGLEIDKESILKLKKQ